jgi:hypothetical protein
LGRDGRRRDGAEQEGRESGAADEVAQRRLLGLLEEDLLGVRGDRKSIVGRHLER